MPKKITFFLSIICFASAFAQTCPTMTAPLNGDLDIAVNTPISWTPIEGVSGYFLLVGTTIGGRDLVDRVDVGNLTTYELPEGTFYPANTVISVKITVYFPNKPDQTCPYELFSTGNAISQQDCGHFINPIPDFYTCDLDKDNFAEFNIDLSTLAIQLIGDQTGLTVTYHNPSGDLIDFSIGTQFAVNQRRIMARATNEDGCFEETLFDLIVLPPPKVEFFDDILQCESFILPELKEGNNYFTQSGGRGTLLFPGDSITNSQRIYIYSEVSDCADQSSFEVFIDPTICEEQENNCTLIFPKYFTPNSDGLHDRFMVLESDCQVNGEVYIFDRYGNLLKQFEAAGGFWDGHYKGTPIHETDYWYKFVDSDSGKLVTGHFSLKR